MHCGPPNRWRASVLAGAALLAGCSRSIFLGDLEHSDCIDTGCGAGSEHGGSAAGSLAQAGSSPTPLGGYGGSAANAAGESGDGGSAGAPSAGAGGQAGAATCQPSAVDQSCDGLDEACQPTTDDQGCSGTCKGAFAQGSSYMTCLADADFDEAEAACQANGMHLVKIDSAAENATVLSLALDDYVWIGGSNRDDPDVFSWTDGTPFYSFGAAVGSTYENFGAGEPAQDSKLRCVQLRQTVNGTWSNWTCTGNQSFVCERY